MAPRAASPAEVTRTAVSLARAITLALRSWGFYPPEHGPAVIWAAEDQTAFILEQIDYQVILEREIDEGPARRDSSWKATSGRSSWGGRRSRPRNSSACWTSRAMSGRLLPDAKGGPYETPLLTNTWDRDSRGEYPWAVVEAVDGPAIGIDPLAHL